MPVRLTCYQGWLYVDLLTGLAYRRVGDGYRQTGTTDAHGYVVCNHLKKLYKVHRVVAELGGLDITNDIDHINGNRADNRLANLRPASRGQNNANSHKARPKLYSSVKGVSYDKARGKWVGHCTIDKATRQHRFDTENQAADWVAQQRKALHGEYAKA